MTERSKDPKRMGERSKRRERETVCTQTQPAFVLGPPALLGDFDGQLSVYRSIMWFLSHNGSPSAPLLIAFVFRGKKIQIPPFAYRHGFATPKTPGGEIKMIRIRKEDNQIKLRGSAPWNSSWLQTKLANAVSSLPSLRPRTANRRQPIAIKDHQGDVANSMNK